MTTYTESNQHGESRERAERDLAVFGMSQEEALADWREYLRANTRSLRQRDMALSSALSDAQEMLAMGDPEAARKLLNRVKLGIWVVDDDAQGS